MQKIKQQVSLSAKNYVELVKFMGREQLNNTSKALNILIGKSFEAENTIDKATSSLQKLLTQLSEENNNLKESLSEYRKQLQVKQAVILEQEAIIQELDKKYKKKRAKK